MTVDSRGPFPLLCDGRERKKRKKKKRVAQSSSMFNPAHAVTLFVPGARKYKNPVPCQISRGEKDDTSKQLFCLFCKSWGKML